MKSQTAKSNGCRRDPAAHPQPCQGDDVIAFLAKPMLNQFPIPVLIIVTKTLGRCISVAFSPFSSAAPRPRRALRPIPGSRPPWRTLLWIHTAGVVSTSILPECRCTIRAPSQAKPSPLRPLGEKLKNPRQDARCNTCCRIDDT